MNLKIHATLTGSEFNLTSSFNLLPFNALLNTIFRRLVQIQLETLCPLSIKHARKMKLFEEGWLPDILPPSTNRILIRKNVQLLYAHGEFYFAPVDWQEFSIKLSHEEMVDAPFVNWARSLRKIRLEGYSLCFYRKDFHLWAFFCKNESGYCEYVMWTERDFK